MLPGMTFLSFSNISVRASRAIRSVRGSFDLPSVITGAVVVAILAVGVFAALFGVIPFAQDHTARQDLYTVGTAEGVAKGRDGKFLTADGLRSAGHLNTSSSLAVGADTAGSCWIGLSRSGSGATFYATSSNPAPSTYSEESDTGCLRPPKQEALAIAVGAAKPAMAAVWGTNDSGQLGNNSMDHSDVPVSLASAGALADKSISDIVGGNNHTCAIAFGDAYCWGNNSYGQLGNGSTTGSAVPVEVMASGALAGKTVTAIAGGQQFTCAIADDVPYCWGRNTYGQLGNGSTAMSTTPVPVNMAGVLKGKTVSAITTGESHSCVLAGGSTYCWGFNGFGQLGNGSTAASSVPVTVTAAVYVLAGKTVQSLAAGNHHTCALADRVYCWGNNAYRQLGNDAVSRSTTPMAVSSTGVLAGKTVTHIGTGASHTCVIADSAAYCWGWNVHGQLGNNTTGDWSLPVPVDSSGVLAGKVITAVALGSSHSCALASGAVYCWGNNNYYGLGNATRTSSPVPVTVTADTALAGRKIKALTSGDMHALVLYK